MRLFNYLNPGDDSGTSKHFSEEKYANSEEVKSGPKPKISAKEQLFMYLSWLKNEFTLSHVSFLFQTPKGSVSRYIITWTNFCFFLLARYLHLSKSTKKCQKYLKEHTPLLNAF